MTKILIHPLNQPTPLLWSIALLPQEIVNKSCLGLEPYLPASKGCWCTELFKMEIRNLHSLLGCLIIVWKISLTRDDWTSGWRSRLASQILISFPSFTLLRCRHVKRLLNSFLPWVHFLRIRNWWRCKWICKNFSRYTMCVPNARRPSLWRRYEGRPQQSFRNRMFRDNIGWLVTWEFPLRTDSASWKSLESFIQITSFCNSCNLPDNAIVLMSLRSKRLPDHNQMRDLCWGSRCADTPLALTIMWVSVEVVVGVRILQCHAIMNVVICVRVMLCHQATDNSGFSTVLNFPFGVQIFIMWSRSINSSLFFPAAIFVCGIHTPRRLQ